ncbi:MAG: hypothetical protein U0U66_04300 [Cytophagaceae bacterium]
MKKHFLLFGLKIALMAALFIVAVGFGFMYLWNWLMPELFQLPVIDFCQSIGIVIMSKILFSGWGRKGHCHQCGGGGFWRHKWKKHMEHMSEEDKARLKERIFSKCMNK